MLLVILHLCPHPPSKWIVFFALGGGWIQDRTKRSLLLLTFKGFASPGLWQQSESLVDFDWCEPGTWDKKDFYSVSPKRHGLKYAWFEPEDSDLRINTGLWKDTGQGIRESCLREMKSKRWLLVGRRRRWGGEHKGRVQAEFLIGCWRPESEAGAMTAPHPADAGFRAPEHHTQACQPTSAPVNSSSI